MDLPVAKNMVGAFHHPSMVLTDVSALRTLPERALREGWAEAVKHGLALDASLLDTYEERAEELLALDPELTTGVVARNAAVKARIVSEDERETSGRRALLNYGHTIGHGIEAAAGYDAYLHGECVAIGMTGAARLGMLAGVTPSDLVERQASLLARFGLPSSYAGVSPEAVLDAMSRDKKTTAGQISWVFLHGAGGVGAAPWGGRGDGRGGCPGTAGGVGGRLQTAVPLTFVGELVGAVQILHVEADRLLQGNAAVMQVGKFAKHASCIVLGRPYHLVKLNGLCELLRLAPHDFDPAS